MAELSESSWRHCSMCKVGIGFEAEYFTCSVSTCNRKRTGLFFCSLACFEAHLPTARHRDAWAESQRSPSLAAARAQREAEEREAEDAEEGDEPPAPAQRRVVSPARAVTAAAVRRGDPGPEAAEERGESESDVLIVVSKLKKYVRDRSGMNTSDTVLAILSDHLRDLCREAIRQAGQDGRRTVLDRDFTKVLDQLAAASPEGNFRSRR